jgi:hypothetical protein
VLPERILVAVTGPKDVESDNVQSDNTCTSCESEIDRVESKVTSLNTICEWNPNEITEREHVTETVGGNVHLGQHG